MESFEGAAIAGDNAFVVPWLSGTHPEVRKRVERYRALLKEHGHPQTRTTFIFFLFIDRDHNAAMRDGRESTRNYTQLFTSFVPPEAMKKFRPEDPFKAASTRSPFIFTLARATRNGRGTGSNCLQMR